MSEPATLISTLRGALDVRGWILLAGISLLVGSGLLLLALAQSYRQATLRDAEATAQNLSRMLAEHAARVMDVANLMAEQAMQLAEGHSWDELERSPAAHEALKRIAATHPFVSALWLADKTGTPRVTTRAFPPPDQSVADRPHFIAQMGEDVGPFVTPLIRSRVRDENNIVLSRRVMGPAGEFRGVALTVINPAEFMRVYADVKSRFAVVIEMFRRDFAMLIRHPGPVAEGEVKHIAKDPSGEIHPPPIGWNEVSGRPRMLEAHDAIGAFGLYVGVGIAEDEIRSVWLAEIVAPAGLALLGLMLVVVFMAVALSQARREAEARAEAQALNLTLETRVGERTATVEQLLLELNHRVKNSLQLIASLLRIQGAAATPEMRLQLDRARGRVMIIARAHERLHKTARIRSIEFDALVRDVADDIFSSRAGGRSIAIVIDACPLPLVVEKALPLALAAAELITNAMQHAFATGGAGSIRITLARIDDGRARLTVADDGQGLPTPFDPEKSGGMGMRLVVGLAGQLGGGLTWQSGTGGTTFSIEFPTGPDLQEIALRGTG